MLCADDFQVYIQCKPAELNERIAELNQDNNRIANFGIYHRS